MIKEEAIEILSDMRAEYNIFSDDEKEATRYHALSLAIQALNEQQRTGQWIPVSERLPDFGISVLLNEGYSYAVGYLIKTTEGKFEWGVNGWYNDLEDWSAWMPLPEPYKGGDAE